MVKFGVLISLVQVGSLIFLVLANKNVYIALSQPIAEREINIANQMLHKRKGVCTSGPWSACRRD